MADLLVSLIRLIYIAMINGDSSDLIQSVVKDDACTECDPGDIGEVDAKKILLISMRSIKNKY
ncbi:MAG: hypothetical protein CVU48_01015 [Candidatus Cloacimonetes bacterium HGW-Cloacimonetes-1]|jgi:hypothetical protein|nr:MAG: hypothetical protein CVU48_01015 [Candidatus Cloacimonetes bacterium HGW-Cloacimonetes-1]